MKTLAPALLTIPAGVALVLIILFGTAIGIYLGHHWRAPPPEPVIIERVDTLYRPPVPEFIEAFRLQCEWVVR